MLWVDLPGEGWSSGAVTMTDNSSQQPERKSSSQLLESLFGGLLTMAFLLFDEESGSQAILPTSVLFMTRLTRTFNSHHRYAACVSNLRFDSIRQKVS